MKDIVAGLVLLLVSVVLYWQATLIWNPGFDLMGPAFTPKLVLVVLALLSLGLIVSGILEHRRTTTEAPDEPAPADRDGLRRQVGVVVLLFLYVVALCSGKVGFEIASLVFALATGGFLMPRTKTAAITLLATSTAVVFGVSYIFRNILFVALP